MRAVLRCGAHGLPPAETALVRTLLRLYKHGASDFRWTFVDAPPYDALLKDWTLSDGPAIEGQTPATAVLSLGPAALAGLPNSLARPLRSELLESWLLQTQATVLSRERPTATRTVQPRPRPVEPAEALGDTAVAAPVNATPPTDAGSATTGDSTLYKLLRWPPAAMLRNDPTQIRLATVLSRRAMNVSELAQLSQRPLDAAHAFVASMRAAGLLITPQAAAPRAVRNPGHRPAAAAPLAHASHRVERSLLSRIRSRLGL